MDIIEAIEARTSVRTFAGEPLSTVQMESINAAMGCVECPLPGSWSMDLQRFELTGSQRPGTYGVIRCILYTSDAPAEHTRVDLGG
ncbi:MAG: hypothetical protein K2I52_07135, partial [Muribaculaceae bacterium]|nr:hypothetical protein [Muribaculaceae bacterium]